MRNRARWPRTLQSVRGFTLLEVMVVVLILGMIAGIATKVVVDRLERARVQTAKIQIHEIMDALEFFYQDNNFYPSSEQGLKALVTAPADERIRDWPENGYLHGVPKDPWGSDYDYISPGAHGRYEIICYGRDAMAGGEGFDADIKSWELLGE
ncbi:MAG: type II secretion system major pseudopilin GspG [Planctomycetes bacterium]|nr:type II secretion system major pseudopilin GspG [Planctomycetota bacterium]